MAKSRASFDPRRLMEQAVDVMRQSRAEPRKDGKAMPKVGAVLWHPDGTTQTAHRGELRDGDHAEFTLLERKNRDKPLEDCVLFATLEPCAPGARKPPKIECAERIVLARIKEVWVGIDDPDPTVARKGIKHLQDAGVTVHMFDHDLQVQIQHENRKFLSQAESRARDAASEPAKPLVLSSMELPMDRLSFRDFSEPALERFREAVGIKARVRSPEFAADLERRGFASRDGDRFVPTGFGNLLFGKSPRDTIPQAGLLATVNYPDGKTEPKDFDGPLVSIPGEVERWLTDKLPNIIDRSSMERRSVPPLPFEMIREAVVNALIHRDYDIKGAKVQLIVTADTITIRSPGRPVKPITIEQLRAFNAPMLSRNPALHYAFSRLDLAEERGLGLRSLRELAEKNLLPLPTYTFEDPYLDLVIYRSQSAAVRALPASIVKQLSAGERTGWEWLRLRGTARTPEYATAQGVAARVARRHLSRFVELGLAKRLGAGPSTSYEVIS